MEGDTAGVPQLDKGLVGTGSSFQQEEGTVGVPQLDKDLAGVGVTSLLEGDAGVPLLGKE